MEKTTLLAFVIYALVLLLIGLLTYHRQKSASDFIIGGRSLNFYVTALSAHASDMSSWLFMAYPSMMFLAGGVTIWAGIGLVVGMWANWHFVARRLRTETEKYQSLTLSNYFAKRFGDHGGILGTVGALLALLFFSVYVSAGLVGMGFLFDSVFDIDPVVGMSIGLGVVILYTFVGGYQSVCWVDLFQGIFLLCAIVLVPIVAIREIGGLDVVKTANHAKGLSLSLVPSNGWSGLPQILLLSLGWGLGYFGQIHILSKFMGIQKPDEINKSKWLGLSWQTICLAAASLIGVVAVAYFPQGLANPELAFVLMVKLLFHPLIAGLILCGILAATISTMDSQILVLVSILSEDIYHRFFRKKATDREMVWISKIFVLFVGLLALLIASLSGGSVMGLVFYSWSGLGSTFGPVLICALYSRQINWYGAMTGMVFGGLVAGLWPTLNGNFAFDIPALIPGFILNLVLIYAVSYATKGAGRRQERW